jgi:hypothetical protein
MHSDHSQILVLFYIPISKMTGQTLFAVGLGSTKIIFKNPFAVTALFR